MIDNQSLSEKDTMMNEEISLKQIFQNIGAWYSYILSKWIYIIAISLVGAAIGYLLMKYQRDKYVATTTFVLEEGGTGSGQLSGIGSIVGLNLSGGMESIFQGENLFELYKSRKMIVKTLLSVVKSDSSDIKLVDKYIEITGLRSKWKENDVPWQNFKFSEQPSRLQDSLLNGIVNEINNEVLTISKLDKKLSIIKVEVEAENEMFAKEFNDQIVKNVNDFYVQTKTGKSLESLGILQFQVDSIRRELDKSITSAAINIDANPNANPARQILKVPSQRGQFNAESNRVMLAELLKNLEVTKMSLRRERPLIQVVDVPLYPLNKRHSSTLLGMIVGALIACVLSVMFFSAKNIYRHVMNS